MTKTQPGERPPGPSGLPFAGNALQAGDGLLAFLTENARNYGDVVYFEVFSERFYQLNDPAAIEMVLLERNEAFTKGDLVRDLLAPVVGRGLFTSEGDRWRTQRHRIEPAFHPDRIADYGAVMTRRTAAAADRWADERRIDVHEAMMGLTLEIVAETLLGVDIASDIDAIGRQLDVILGHIDRPTNLLLPDWVPTPGNRRYRRAIADLETIVEGIIAERRAEPAGSDIVSQLLAVGADEGMSARQLRDEVMTFLIAGHETTAVALTYTCYLLATHPPVEDRLVGELHADLDGPPTPADVGSLDLLDRVITEALRLYPPANRISREPVEPVTIDGYRIPDGATIVLPQWVVQRDPRWFPDPLAFHPGRWTESFRAELPRLAYFPFGAGPRRCIGDRFARLEAALVLATVLRSYHLDLRSETDFAVEAAVTTRPVNPVWMTVAER